MKGEGGGSGVEKCSVDGAKLVEELDRDGGVHPYRCSGLDSWIGIVEHCLAGAQWRGLGIFGQVAILRDVV
jgi:hypothetical protein